MISFIHMKLYNDYNTYLRERYGRKVYRIALDAGYSCPNRDGSKGSGGCIYCSSDGSRAPYSDPQIPVGRQLGSRIAYLKEAKRADRFIAYFQAFTNTYAALPALKSVYDEILPFEDVVGISIGTRPDAIDEDKLRLISTYKKRYEVWLEYGLQSASDKTLELIKRGHTFSDFCESVERTRKFGIPVSAHVILGLPGETRDDILYTARKITELKIDGIKIHVLHILKNSVLEKSYKEGKIKLLERDEYAELVCDFLENLAPGVIVQRLTAQGVGSSHIAPAWAVDKMGTIRKIEETFKRRGTYQGFKLIADS